ncbi:MAG: hypothetical protein GXO73_00330 [Calditrichaeota bacterium]|nr:hypothetical protein [Calditrichota bacterium]
MRKRLARVEGLIDELRQQGLDVDSVLESIHRDPELSRLWREIDSNILERSAEGRVSLDEALRWLETLDRWTKAVIERLQQLPKQHSQA